jgi:hypothetical protein
MDREVVIYNSERRSPNDYPRQALLTLALWFHRRRLIYEKLTMTTEGKKQMPTDSNNTHRS